MTQSPWPAPPPGPQQPAIARYATPKRPSGLLILLVALLVVVAGVVIVTTAVGPAEEATESPSSSSAISSAPQRSGGSTIDQAGVTGYWRITSTRWGNDSVTVYLEIDVDSGILACEFYAFVDETAEILVPVATTNQSLTGVVYVSPGQTLTGELTFRTSRTDLTLIMNDGSVQLSALPIKA
ncbi:MAG: hypothetical protein LBL92_06335 [Propionibacteriaceae bacterium]|nr:hypothetical protein [Propionibacteriaceae bacterium]